jgi:hypothetical protein
MEQDSVSTPEKLKQLREDLAKHHSNDDFLECETMGAVLKLQLKSTLATQIRKVRNL